MFLNLLLLLDFVFDTFDLSVIFDRITGYIRFCGDFRFAVSKYYYDKSSRGQILDIFKTVDLNRSLCSS